MIITGHSCLYITFCTVVNVREPEYQFRHDFDEYGICRNCGEPDEYFNYQTYVLPGEYFGRN